MLPGKRHRSPKHHWTQLRLVDTAKGKRYLSLTTSKAFVILYLSVRNKQYTYPFSLFHCTSPYKRYKKVSTWPTKTSSPRRTWYTAMYTPTDAQQTTHPFRGSTKLPPPPVIPFTMSLRSRALQTTPKQHSMTVLGGKNLTAKHSHHRLSSSQSRVAPLRLHADKLSSGLCAGDLKCLIVTVCKHCVLVFARR